MREIRAISGLARLALVTILLTGCSPAPSPRAVTLDDAIKAAVSDVGFGSAEQLYRGQCADRVCVLVAKADDERAIALIVLEAVAPYRVQASATGLVGGDPGTLDEMGTDDTEFVYGRINDARISKLELDLLDGGTLTFDVTQPGYAVAYPETRGPVQESRFRDASGHVVRD